MDRQRLALLTIKIPFTQPKPSHADLSSRLGYTLKLLAQ